MIFCLKSISEKNDITGVFTEGIEGYGTSFDIEGYSTSFEDGFFLCRLSSLGRSATHLALLDTFDFLGILDNCILIF